MTDAPTNMPCNMGVGCDEYGVCFAAANGEPDRCGKPPSTMEASVAGKLNVIDEIAAERRRQVEAEGWTPQHDDEHVNGSMAVAASCYALHSTESDGFRRSFAATTMHELWPWPARWWKPKDRRRDLIRAGALIVAEIERLDRAALASHEHGGEGNG